MSFDLNISVEERLAHYARSNQDVHFLAFKVKEAEWDRYASRGKTLLTSDLGRISICNRTQFGRGEGVIYSGQLANFHMYIGGQWVAPSAVVSDKSSGIAENVLSEGEPALGIIAVLTGMVKNHYRKLAQAARGLGKADEARAWEEEARSFHHSAFVGDGGQVEFDMPASFDAGQVRKLYEQVKNGRTTCVVMSVRIEMDGLDVRIRADRLFSTTEAVKPLRRPNNRLQVGGSDVLDALRVIQDEIDAVDSATVEYNRLVGQADKFKAPSRSQERNKKKRQAYLEAKKATVRPSVVNQVVVDTSTDPLDLLASELDEFEVGGI